MDKKTVSSEEMVQLQIDFGLSETEGKVKSGEPKEAILMEMALRVNQAKFFEKIQELLARPSVNGRGELRYSERLNQEMFGRQLYELLLKGELTERRLNSIFALTGAELYLYLAEIVENNSVGLDLKGQLEVIRQILEGVLFGKEYNVSFSGKREGQVARISDSYELAKEHPFEDKSSFMIERVFSVGKKKFSRISESEMIRLFSRMGLGGYVIADLKLFEIEQLEIAQSLIESGGGEELTFYISAFESDKLPALLDLIILKGLTKQLLESVDGLVLKLEEATIMKWLDSLQTDVGREVLLSSIRFSIAQGNVPAEKFQNVLKKW